MQAGRRSARANAGKNTKRARDEVWEEEFDDLLENENSSPNKKQRSAVYRVKHVSGRDSAQPAGPSTRPPTAAALPLPSMPVMVTVSEEEDVDPVLRSALLVVTHDEWIALEGLSALSQLQSGVGEGYALDEAAGMEMD